MRPDCAGWHEPDPTCDGGPGEAACSWRRLCSAVVELAGGREGRTVASVHRVLNENDDEDLELVVPTWGEQPPAPAPAPRAPLPPPTPAGKSPEAALLWALRGRSHRTPPPYHKVPGSLAVLERMVSTFASELELDYRGEGEDRQFGDIFLRFPTKTKMRATICQTMDSGKYRNLCRIFMGIRSPKLTLAPCMDDMVTAQEAGPPKGCELASWHDKRGRVVLKEVRIEHAVEAGRWLARIYTVDQLGHVSLS